MDSIQETPDALVENGRIHTGFFKTPFRRVNLLDASAPGRFLGKPFRRLRLKEWVGFGISHPQLYGGVLIQNARYAASAVFYLYDRQTQTKAEWLLVDLPMRVQLPETLWTSECACGGSLRKGRILFQHDLTHFRHHVHADILSSGGRPALFADLVFHQDWRRVQPLVVSLPIPPHHHTYTHKSPLRIEGRIRIGDAEYCFEPSRDMGNLDEQKTYYPYRSQWHWGCFGARTGAGHEVMLNLVDQMTEKGKPGEDALWINGELMLLEPAQFIPEAQEGGYRLEDKTGRIKLQFKAEGAKMEQRNYLVVAINYRQYFGAYSGEIVDNNGHTHVIENAFGALERMRARF